MARTAVPGSARASWILLAAGCLLMAASAWLPPGHHRSFRQIIAEDAAALADYVELGAWLESVYFAGRIGVLAASPVATLLIVVTALLPSRVAFAVAASGHCAILAVLAATAWVTASLNDSERLAPILLAAGCLLSVVAAAEVVLVVRLAASRVRRSDALHILPLALFAVLGIGVTAALWRNETWPPHGLLAIGAGSAIALVGVWLRGYCRARRAISR